MNRNVETSPTRRARPWWHVPACLLLLLLGTLATGPGQSAHAQTATTCGVAASKGTDGPIDYGAYCWIDFSSYNASQATGSGQNFVVTLPGGATLTFKLKLSANNVTSSAVPTWYGAAFGNAAFLTIPNKPVLYHNTNNTTTTVTLSNLNLSANGSPDLPFVFVAADGESTNNGETLSFTTAGDPWQLVDSPGSSDPGRTMPPLSGVGTATVTETGNQSGSTGSYVFTTDNSPGTVSATMHGSGLQGVLFGLKFHSIDLAVTKTYSGQAYAGGTGSYTLDVTNTAYPNQQPPTDLQPIRVVDTLPNGITYTGFSGTNWSCSASGQVVTCNLPNANLNTPANTTVHMPALTLNVAIAANAQTTLVNQATVQDVTTGYVFDVNQVNNSTSQTLTLLRPDLSTSTKTVVDLNGGDANPGDILQYTITLTESGGVAANNVSVADDMPPGVTGLSVASTPAGSTNASTTSGGANGTGKINVTGINVPANASVAIVYNVTVAAGDAPGYTIDNTATISNPTGTGANPVAPTVTVSQSLVTPPASGNKVLYVYANGSMSRNRQAAAATTSINGLSYTNFTLTPAVAKALVLTPSHTVGVSLLLSRTGSTFFTSDRTVHVELYRNGSTLIGSSASQTFNSATLTTYNFTLTVPTNGNGTLSAGDTLVLRVVNESGYSGRTVDLQQYVNATTRSTVSFDTSTVINVDSVSMYSVPFTNVPNTTTKATYSAGDTVYVRAVISDPFGSFDVDHATVKLTDPMGTVIVPSGAMSQVADSGVATRTYEYAYTVQAGDKAGSWTASVTGYEGKENAVKHTRIAYFSVVVPMPDLIIVKSVTAVSDPVEGTTRPKALPGATMQYHINVSNNGPGTVDNNTLVVTDPIPANTKFVVGSSAFNQGSPSSGLSLGAGNITYSNDGGATWTYGPPTSDGSGADPNVTNVKFSTQGTMNAKTGATAPSFEITFKVIIK